MVNDATPVAARRQGDRPQGGVLRRIAPPDPRQETFQVARAAVIVLAGALLWIGRGAGTDARTAGDDGFTPWQRAFASLPAPLQRDLRELHEAGEETLRWRDDRGTWPAVADLGSDGIVPFAPSQRDPARVFERRVAPYALQYLGRAAESRALLLQVLEPRPGEDEGQGGLPVPLDEQHRRLADGTLLHVSFWIGPEPASDRSPRGAFLADPALAGFEQVLFGASQPVAAVNGELAR